MIGYYNYTVILTYVGTLFGFAGMIYVWNDNMKVALICLMIAGFCDMFDGKIASTMKRTKQENRFGIQIDSLSDFLCFGVLPALIMVHCSKATAFSVFISAIYVLCALIRLAWFNVDEEERQDIEDKSRGHYIGLPVTTVALLLPFFVGSTRLLRLPPGRLCPWLILGIAIAFLSPFHIRKPRIMGKIIIMLLGFLTLALVLVEVKI